MSRSFLEVRGWRNGMALPGWRGLLEQSMAESLCSLSSLLLLPEQQVLELGAAPSLQPGTASPPLTPVPFPFLSAFPALAQRAVILLLGMPAPSQRLCMDAGRVYTSPFMFPGRCPPSQTHPSADPWLAGSGGGGSRGCAHGAVGD